MAHRSTVAAILFCATVLACGPLPDTSSDSSSFATGGAEAASASSADETTTIDECDQVYEGTLSIDQDTDLAALSAFARVARIDGDLEVKWTTLVDLAFLGCLREVNGTIEVMNNVELKSLAGLERLELMEYEGEPTSLYISGNPKLESLAGIGPVQSLFRLSLIRNPALESLALHDLQSVEWLEIGDCEDGTELPDGDLVEINGLSSLQSLDGVFIAGQRNLSSLGQLHEISVSGWHGFGNVTLYNNPSLPYAEIETLAHVTEQAGKLTDGCGGDEYPIPICPQCPEH